MKHRKQSTPRRAAIASGALAIALATALPSVQAKQAQDDSKNTPQELARAGKVFQESCTFCHLAPDPSHPTDRAWLNQVSDTA